MNRMAILGFFEHKSSELQSSSPAMAHLVRRPLARGLQSLPAQTCIHQRRTFKKPSGPERKMPNQPSLKIAMKQNVQMPSDLGLLQGMVLFI